MWEVVLKVPRVDSRPRPLPASWRLKCALLLGVDVPTFRRRNEQESSDDENSPN